MTPPAATVAGRTETKRRTSEDQPQTQRQRPNGARPQQPREVPAPSRKAREAEAAFARPAEQQRRPTRSAPAKPTKARRASGPGAGPAGETRGLTAAATRAARASGASNAAPRANTATAPRPATVNPRVPRVEISAPARRARRQAVEESRRPLHHRVLRGITSLPDHKLLDRVVRGRAWIPVLGVLLVTIVGMRVEVLKMGASVGRATTQASTLESSNELLLASVSTLSSDQRIEALAARDYNMVMPGPSAIHYIRAGSGNAATVIAPPDPASFRESVAEGLVTDPNTVIPTDTLSAVGSSTVDSGTSSTTGVTDPSALAAADTSAATDTAAPTDVAAADTTAANAGTTPTDTVTPTDTAASNTGTTPMDTVTPTDTAAANTGTTPTDTVTPTDTAGTPGTGVTDSTTAGTTDGGASTGGSTDGAVTGATDTGGAGL